MRTTTWRLCLLRLNVGASSSDDALIAICVQSAAVIMIFVNPPTGVGSKMTPDVTFKAWYDGKIKVAAVIFHENYSAGGHCLFQFSEQAALP